MERMRDEARQLWYQGGEGGEQQWRSTAQQGRGGDRDMSGHALTVLQRGWWNRLVAAEDVWRKFARLPEVGEAEEVKAQCALSTLRTLLRDYEASVQLLVRTKPVRGRGHRGVYHFPASLGQGHEGGWDSAARRRGGEIPPVAAGRAC